MQENISEKINWELIRQLRHTLHAHPELSGQEAETKTLLMDFIHEYTNLAVKDMGSWFYAVYEPENRRELPPIAFRADMDALPMPESRDLPYGSVKTNVAHKCGHDGHSAALAALALMLEIDAKIERPVYLIFQSAEETGKGGKACAEFLKSAGVGEVYAFHNLSGYPENAVMVRNTITQCASVGLAFHFQGRASHAGTPELGISPAPALARLELYAEQRIHEMTERQKNCPGINKDHILLLTTVGMNVGGMDFGISPGDGTIAFTLRAEDEEELKEMKNDLAAESEKLAGAYGLTVSCRENDAFPATVNNMTCAARVRRAAENLGLRTVPMEYPWRPSEDFGWYLKVCPGAMFYVGNGENWPAPHQPDYDFNDKILRTAPSVFIRLAENFS